MVNKIIIECFQNMQWKLQIYFTRKETNLFENVIIIIILGMYYKLFKAAILLSLI